MAEYIEREAVKQRIVDEKTENRLNNHPAAYKVGYHNGLTMALAMVTNATAAEVAPVMHGRWVEWWPPKHMILTGEEMLYRCSVCDAKYSDKENMRYCPNCGARMDGE